MVFLCGLQSDMEGIKARSLERLSRARGRSCILFDYQGHGRSTGSFAGGTIGLWLDDALAVLDELAEGPQLLVGSSMGGWLALLAALARPTRIAGMVLLAPATDFTEALIWGGLNADRRRALIEAGQISLPSEYDPDGYLITRALIEEGRRHLLLGGAIPIQAPVRIFHGMQDGAVPWRHSITLTERLATGDVRLTLIKDGDHRLSRPMDLDLLAAAVDELSGS